jgi:hypothetical protein
MSELLLEMSRCYLFSSLIRIAMGYIRDRGHRCLQQQKKVDVASDVILQWTINS